jgi:hypothetical protein
MPTVNKENVKRSKREQRRHFLDVNLTGLVGTLLLYLLGEDIEELNREISWNTNTAQNILGKTVVTSKRGEESISSLKIFAYEPDDPLTLLCEYLDEQEADMDDIKRYYYEAKIDADGDTITAFKKVADIKVTSVGGGADSPDGYEVDLVLSGKKIPQSYDYDTDTFTNV